jgi:hypothetical protein
MQLEERIDKRVRQGALLIAPLILIPTMLTLFADMIDPSLLSILTLLFISFALASVSYSLDWGRNGRRYLYGLRIMDLISPPHPILGPRDAVVDRAPVYIVLSWRSTNLLFIRLLEPEMTNRRKTRLPRFIPHKDFTYQIDGVGIARREELLVFPKDAKEAIMGEGVLYALPLQRGFWVPKKNPISKEILLSIVRQLSLDLVQKNV